jgi:hypothetical protein
MNTNRFRVLCVTTCLIASIPSGISGAPIARADDPLAPIKTAVNGDRSRTPSGH